MSRNSRNPISWVPTVYFAMGLPFVVLNMVSVLMFKGLGIDDAQIALWTSLIMLPWTLKFLWSPFLEMFKTKKFFVVLTQLITGAGFALVALALHLPAFFAVCIALLAIIAFSGATHDVATDGVYMSELNKQDQAKYIGWQGAFYNIAKIVASGGLVWLAGWLLKHYGGVPGAEETVRHEATVQAWMTVMFILAAVMVLLGVYHMRMLPSGGTAATGTTSGKETWNRLVEVIRNFFQKKHIWVLHYFHHSLSFGRRLCHEDSAVVSEGGTFSRWSGTGRTGDRFVLWYLWGGCICTGFPVGRLLYISQRVESHAVFTVLHFQSSVSGLYTTGCLSAGERYVDRRCHCA